MERIVSSSAATISIILLLVSLFVVNISRKFAGTSYRSKIGPGTSRQSIISNIGKFKYLSFSLLTILNAFIIGVPSYVLITRSLNVRQELDFSQLLNASLNTIQVSFVGATLALLLAVPLGILGARFKTKLANKIESTILITHAVPSIVIALSLVALSVKWLPFIYQTIFLLAIAYALLFLANSIGIVKANISKVSTQLEEVSRSLGKNYLSTLFKVTIPVALPGILSGWLLVFVTAMKEDLKDRRVLSEEGFISVFVVVDPNSGLITAGPEIRARAFAEEDHVFDDVKPQIEKALLQAAREGIRDTHSLQQVIRRSVGGWVSKAHRRKPMIIPVVIHG